MDGASRKTIAYLLIFAILAVATVKVTEIATRPKIIYIERWPRVTEMQEFAGVDVDDVWGPITDREYRRAQAAWERK